MLRFFNFTDEISKSKLPAIRRTHHLDINPNATENESTAKQKPPLVQLPNYTRFRDIFFSYKYASTRLSASRIGEWEEKRRRKPENWIKFPGTRLGCFLRAFLERAIQMLYGKAWRVNNDFFFSLPSIHRLYDTFIYALVASLCILKGTFVPIVSLRRNNY